MGAPVDLVVLAGNVVVYLTPGTEPDLAPHLAGWLAPGGLLVAGFAADRHVSARDWDGWCDAAGLEHVASHAGWDGAPLGAGDDPEYLVSVHRKRSLSPMSRTRRWLRSTGATTENHRRRRP